MYKPGTSNGAPSCVLAIESHVGKIRLSQPETGNVINAAVLSELAENLRKCIDDKSCRALVLSGSSGVFCRGMDFRAMLAQGAEGFDKDFAEPYREVVLQLRNSPKPVVAAVDGEVLAGGLGLVLACDVVIATTRSSFALPEVLFGLIPAYVLPLLLERVSLKRARYMALSTQRIDAATALAFGIVDEVVHTDAGTGQLDKAISRLLKRLLWGSPQALGLVKRYTDDLVDKRLSEAMADAGMLLADALNDTRNRDAIRDFMEGERPSWSVSYKRLRRHA